MRRRALIANIAGTAVWPLAAHAQQPTAVLQAGGPKRLVHVASQPRSGPLFQAFEARLRELGWQEGRNLIVRYRVVEKPEQYAAVYADLAATGADLLLSSGPEQALAAARAASRTIPIVFVAINFDPVSRGYIASLARPGGRLSGVFMQQTEYTGKRIELLREAFPDTQSIAVLWDRYGIDFLSHAEAAIGALGLTARTIRVEDTGSDLEGRLREAATMSTPVVMLGSPIFFRERARIAAAGLALRLPIMATDREAVQEGALLSFGPSIAALYSRTADYADKVLRGTDPTNLPVEQPTRFELTINVKTAKALGLTLPAAFLARADEVIE